MANGIQMLQGTFTPSGTPSLTDMSGLSINDPFRGTPTITPIHDGAAPTNPASPTFSFTVTSTPVPTLLPPQVSEMDGMVMQHVPEGEFSMGLSRRQLDALLSDHSDWRINWFTAEQPRHTVYLDSFWIDRTEVTNAMFAQFLNQQGNQIENGVTWLEAESPHVKIHLVDGVWVADSGYENYPVVEVTWYGARAYCTYAGRRLPTEAEWEKAARGTDERTYPWGEGIDCGKAQYEACGEGTVPVDSFPQGASPYGALNMAGNAWEWTADLFTEDFYRRLVYRNPTGPAVGMGRVLRGGSWYMDERSIRTTNRDWFHPTVANAYGGFRCAKSSSESND